MERRTIEARVSVVAPRRLKGYAVKYDSRSSHYIAPATRERISKTAFARSLGSGTDVRFLYEHKAENLLGRTSSGTLSLRSDDDGLGFDLQLPDTQLGRDVFELTKRGDIRGMSFGFVCREDSFGKEFDEDEFGDSTEDNCIVRTVRSADLIEVSAVSEPAYESSSVLARHFVADNIEARAKAFALANLNPREIDARNRIRAQYLAGLTHKL